MEDYLKLVYELQELDKPVTNSTLAAWLEIAPSSVTNMIQRLSKLKLVDYKPYEGIKLTRQGEQIALKVVRYHRLIEIFLTEILDVPWDRVHKEAHQLEHVLSEYLADRMSVLLGDPQADPHGRPIPDRNGRVGYRQLKKLSSIKPGESVVIACVNDENPDLLRYLGDLGLYPDTAVDVLGEEPFGGVMHIRVNGIERALGSQAAEHVWIRVR
jgi:DtxR family Mn-dependent transcriptional regulator